MNLRSKYPQSDKILSDQPDISVRLLASQLGVSPDTAHRIKKEWAESHKPSKAEKEKKALAEGALLSRAEATEMQSTLVAALDDDFRYLDEYLWSRQKHINPDADCKEIWSNLDEEEIQRLASVMIRGGQHNPAMATVARGIVASRDYVVTVAIVGPRVKQTFEVVRATHQPPKKRSELNAH